MFLRDLHGLPRRVSRRVVRAPVVRGHPWPRRQLRARRDDAIPDRPSRPIRVGPADRAYESVDRLSFVAL